MLNSYKETMAQSFSIGEPIENNRHNDYRDCDRNCNWNMISECIQEIKIQDMFTLPMEAPAKE